ncbi:MAG: aminomethyl-transferring glycine dehydrogenase subunit GcvPB [Nitrospirota bacterium]
MPEPLLFEKSTSGRRGYAFPALDVPATSADSIPQTVRRATPPALPQLSEVDVIRHYTRLSRENYGVDAGFYPLGSCTMKYNPKINEEMARQPGAALAHPLQGEALSQGALRLMWELEQGLKEVAGVDRVSLQPAAGAQGEFAGILMIRAYHAAKGSPRRRVLIPDSAHGTNPATAALAGYEVQTVHSNAEGLVDVSDLAKLIDQECAALMLTNPNTLGLFEKEILDIARIVHDAGALLYMDGANLNALLGLVRPGDMGFDVVHFNLHKTFSTPHGGGGPGAGPIGVKAALIPHLPTPTVERDGDRFYLDDNRPHSIGRLHGFYGNFGILVRAYTYLRRLGAAGLADISRHAIINANYVRARLGGAYQVAYDRACMHECIFSAKRQRAKGVHAWDIAKRLIDYGIYPPTINFPMVVEEAIMVEPPESESKQMIDAFCDAMLTIAKECEDQPDLVKTAPHTTPRSRLDEVLAARKPQVRWVKHG